MSQYQSEEIKEAPKTQIVSSKDADQQEETLGCVDRWALRQERCLKYFQIDMIMEADLEEDAHEIQQPELKQFRKEVDQLHKWTSKMSNYLVFLTVVYFLMAAYTYYYLDRLQFYRYVKGASHALQVYNYAVTIEQMKIVHSLTLISIAIFVSKLVRAKRVLSEKQYTQMFIVITAACIIYFLPVIYLLYLTYSDNTAPPNVNDHNAAWNKFFKYVHVMLNKLDFSGYGFFMSYMIHLQIYAILFGLQISSSRIKALVDKAQIVRSQTANGGGSYDALELNSLNSSVQIDLQTEQTEVKQEIDEESKEQVSLITTTDSSTNQESAYQK